MYFRQFALGCLLYTPDRFDKTRVGDMLDAITGYTEADVNRLKALASYIRTATTLLWNTQIVEGERLTDEQLWPFAWEQRVERRELSVEEKEAIRQNAEKQAEFLIKHFPDGNSDIKS